MNSHGYFVRFKQCFYIDLCACALISLHTQNPYVFVYFWLNQYVVWKMTPEYALQFHLQGPNNVGVCTVWLVVRKILSLIDPIMRYLTALQQMCRTRAALVLVLACPCVCARACVRMRSCAPSPASAEQGCRRITHRTLCTPSRQLITGHEHITKAIFVAMHQSRFFAMIWLHAEQSNCCSWSRISCDILWNLKLTGIFWESRPENESTTSKSLNAFCWYAISWHVEYLFQLIC